MSDLVLGINVGLAAFSLVLLALLIAAECQQIAGGIDHPRSQKIFLALLLLNVVFVAADLVSRLDGRPGWETLCRTGNLVLFLISPAPLVLWYLYLCEQVRASRQERSHGLTAQLVLFLANAALTLATPATGWLYAFDADGVYHRGPLFWITGTLMLAMAGIAELLTLRCRNRVERSHFYALLFFPSMPALSGMLQVLFYGVAFGPNSTVLAMMVVFYYVQSRSMDRDYLTGLYNRRKLDAYLQQKISGGKSFSAILLDLDRFKSINDTHGHSAGDTALEDAANLLRGCLRAGTFIARYGGDEFCAVLDTSDPDALRHVMRRIREAAGEFARDSGKPYTLSFSLGGDIYAAGSGIGLEEFQNRIDALMYADKQAARRQRAKMRQTPPRAVDRRLGRAPAGGQHSSLAQGGKTDVTAARHDPDR